MTTDRANSRVDSFRIDAMDCPTEEGLIRRALGGMRGVHALDFDLVGRTLRVTHELSSADAITSAIRTLGMEPIALTHGRATTPAAPAVPRGQWVRMALAGVAAIGTEVVAYVTGNDTSLAVGALALIAILLGGLQTLAKGWVALRRFALNINLLMTVAVIGALLIGQWPEAAVVIWLFGLAEMIEALSLERARNAIRGLMALAPEQASVQQADGSWLTVPAEAIALGARVRVKPGERIALDGVVLDGRSAVNQAPITGESLPVDKGPGDALFAGTINEQGALEYRVTAAKGDTTLDRIARSIQGAQAQRAPTQRFVDRFARVYTPAVFLFAIGVAVVPPLAFGAAWSEWIYTALVLLVIACPCALVISTPVTIVSGLAAAARHGILVKGGLYLEQGKALRIIALDKTGTLTHGKPQLTDVVPLSGITAEEALRLAASLDALSEHPVAAAIVAAHADKPLAQVSAFENLPGRGVTGTIDGVEYFIGNHRLIEELRACEPAVEEALDRLEYEAKTAVVLASRTRALAVLAVADTVRPESVQAIADMRALGIEPVMLTGDNTKTAQAIAAQVDIADVRAELLPQHKLDAIGELARRGAVGMVGDGVNDAPALARANIGFAMGAAGTDTAIETADVALMKDDLRKLPEFVRLSRATSRVLWQNIAIALGIKAVFFVLALTGEATLWMAVFADLGASLIVIFNGLRLLHGTAAIEPRATRLVESAA